MLHPQTQTLLDRLKLAGRPPTSALTPVEARRSYRERCFAEMPAPPPMAWIRDLRAAGPHGPIPLRFYRPRGCASRLPPVLVYFHGGGWVTGDLDTHDVLCRELAIAARIAVAGDSAGGNLAAVVALSARDAGDLPISLQLLIYPITDQRRIAASHLAYGQGYGLTCESLAYYHQHYIASAEQDLDWRASPLLRDDLTRLPPAFVLVAGHDPLRDEGLMYSQRLSEAGNQVTHICFERQIHGFIKMGKVLDEARSAVALCAAHLRDALPD